MLKEWSQRVMQRWIQRKLPPAERVELGLSNIMIVPTRLGFAVLLLCAILFLLAINYENNMGFALSFMLLSVWLLGLHWTFSGLSGLRIQQLDVGQAHVGDDVGFRLKLSSKGDREKFAIEMFWDEQAPTIVDVMPDQENLSQVFVKATERGKLNPGRLQVVSYYPFMMFRAWSSIAMVRPAFIFPAPLECGLPEHQTVVSNQAAKTTSMGHDELAGIRPYQTADPLHHIAWKASARSANGLVSKYFESPSDHRIWLTDKDMPGPTYENRLSQLCYWCLQLEQQSVQYGLSVGQEQLNPNRGASHLIQCLTTLASQPKAGK